MASSACEVLSDIRLRASSCLSARMSDVDGNAISLMTGITNFGELCEYALEGGIRREVLDKASDLSLTDEEFKTLFASGNAYTTTPKLSDTVSSAEFCDLQRRLESSLVTTLQEEPQKTHWRSNPVTRAAAVLALLRASDSLDCLNAVVGGVVISDRRRLEDLKSAVEDDVLDVMLLHETVMSLAGCMSLFTVRTTTAPSLHAN